MHSTVASSHLDSRMLSLSKRFPGFQIVKSGDSTRRTVVAATRARVSMLIIGDSTAFTTSDNKKDNHPFKTVIHTLHKKGVFYNISKARLNLLKQYNKVFENLDIIIVSANKLRPFIKTKSAANPSSLIFSAAQLANTDENINNKDCQMEEALRAAFGGPPINMNNLGEEVKRQLTMC